MFKDTDVCRKLAKVHSDWVTSNEWDINGLDKSLSIYYVNSIYKFIQYIHTALSNFTHKWL